MPPTCPNLATAAPRGARGCRPRAVRRAGATTAAALVAALGLGTAAAPGQDTSAPAMLQLFESSWQNTERRAADAFLAGYGGVWVPPPGRADSGGFSVGYDQYDRFDLGSPGNTTLYGTETGLRTAIDAWHRFGGNVYADLVWNHNGFRDASTPGFVANGDYPGFVTTTTNAIDGDFHSGYAGGVIEGRTSGLIDIDHSTNLRYVRNPVFRDTASNIPNEAASNLNRRFYPSHDGPSRTLYDPRTGEHFTAYSFRGDGSELLDGTPVEENALGYLMRNAQWYVQDVGFDGFRLDATKHMEPWVLNYYDRAVYAASLRKNLDGSTRHVFAFGEALDGNMSLLQSYTRKDINPATPNVVGGNRDALDFPLHFALKANLSSNGLQNDWRNIVNASFDVHDDGLANNGSQGVAFDASHDDYGADLGNVANAYLSMRPGNWIVYHNAKEFGNGRDFPKDGRGDGLGGMYGDTITTLVGLRNTHGRGNFLERSIDKEVFVYERDKSVVVGLNNRSDGGFDERWVQTNFAPGTHLLELTGNAADAKVDPFNDIPEVVTVGADGRIAVRTPRNQSAAGEHHGNGYVMYGLATPQGELSLGNVAQVISGGTPTAASNGTTRLADLEVIKSDSFQVSLQTQQVNLLGLSSLRDRDADGDNAVLRFNEGLDVNGNGRVDYVQPGSVVYGFEQFSDKSSPLHGGGDGQFVQTVDTDQLVEGMNYLEVRAFRHRDDGGPAVYSSFKKVLYVDRYAPESEVAGVTSFDGASENFRQFQVRSVDKTADSVHTFLNLPASLTDEQIRAMVDGGNKAGQIDRDLFAYGYDNLASGNHVLTTVTYEITGNVSVQRFAGLGIETARGEGVGDVNADGHFGQDDVFGSGAFEQFLYSQNTQFSPAADVTGDGLVDSHDLFALRPLYTAAGASEAAQEARAAELRRGNVDGNGQTNAADIDFLFANLGSDEWLFDLDSDGGLADKGDVDTLVRRVFLTEYGDANLDGQVNFTDFLSLRGGFGQAGGWAKGDFTGNGLVDFADFLVLRGSFGYGTAGGVGAGAEALSIPEPALAGPLLAGLLLLRRRRTRTRTEFPVRRTETLKLAYH